MQSEYKMRARLAVLVFTILSLGVSTLSSANARFAVVLRDRARLDYINTTDIVLDTNFQSLQNNILIAETITALGTAVFAICGAAIVVNPRWLRENESILEVFGFAQLIVAFVMLVTGGYTADHVHGLQTSFTKFGANDSIPYYSIIYYGNVAQVAYGSVLMFLAITICVGYYGTKQHRAKQAMAAGPVARSNDIRSDFEV